MSMGKLAIYTALTGEKEPLGDPISRLKTKETDLEIDLICFTDNPHLKSNAWEIRSFDTHSLPPEKSSRRPKILAYQYLPDYKYSLYIDNICELKRIPTSHDLVTSATEKYVFRTFKHNTRSLLIQEAFAIASLGYDDPRILAEQLETYNDVMPLDKITPLSTCTVLLREHNNPNIIEHSNQWWDQVLQFSKRDQMSFDFCRLTRHIKINYFQGNKFENDLIFPHENVGGWRKAASFDEKKYLRLRRELQQFGGDPNLSVPQETFLREKCYRTDSSLELFSYLNNSPLTSAQHTTSHKLKELKTFLDCLKSKHAHVIASLHTGTGESTPEIVGYEMLKCGHTITQYLGKDIKTVISPSELLSWINQPKDNGESAVFLVLALNYSTNHAKELWKVLELEPYFSKAKVAQVSVSFDENLSLTLFLMKNF